jgi:tryptophan synthase alpha chain
MLDKYIRERLELKDILLMTHIVAGYPSYEDSVEIVKAMEESGVDIVEFQLPFSEPIADGPVILRANQEALKRGASLEKTFACLQSITQQIAIPVVVMTYYNPIFKFGIKEFVEKMAELRVKGLIVPDLPMKEGSELFSLLRERDIDPIVLLAPTTSQQRLELLGKESRGFVYCVARRGVTGSTTSTDDFLTEYLCRSRAACQAPLAVGFGIRSRQDVEYLIGKSDIAVVGSEMIRRLEQSGVNGVRSFVRELQGSGS